MHSFGRVLVLGGLLCARGALAADATITPAPTAQGDYLKVKRQDNPDPISLARILLTAVPESIREIAATNVPAASSILWEQFLGGKRPEWFLELPEDIQSYLVREFGPKTTWPTAWPTARPTNTWWSWPTTTTTSKLTASGSATTRVPSSRATPSRGGSSTRQPGSTPSPSPTTLISSRRPSSTSGSEDSSSSSPSSSPTSSTTSSATSSDPSTPIPDSPPAANDGLTKSQKIGLGVGIPIGVLGAAALFFACCTLFRRRQKKNVDGSIPPSSPGFIPRFAFQERSADDTEHRTPLNRDVNNSAPDLGPQQPVDWEDDGVDPTDTMGIHNPYTMNTPYTLNDYGAPATGLPQSTMPNNIYSTSPPPGAGMAMHDPTPIMAPALFHTHSSNRARGMRTSYTSLHSVAEVTEPDESADTTESPILGRRSSGASPPRNLLPTPPIPAGATIKRKPVTPSPPPPPVPKSPPVSATPAAHIASRKLIRQTMPEHSSSSSSGLALTTTTSTTPSTTTGTSSSTGLSSTSGLALAVPPTNSNPTPNSTHDTPSPVSPLSSRAPSNPFQYDSYVEDYGPEYQGAYVDVEDGLYGGNTSLGRYPEARRGSGSGRRGSKTEWPLRNLVGSTSGHRRKSSPIWDRIYEE